jgi:hypothetical protein
VADDGSDYRDRRINSHVWSQLSKFRKDEFREEPAKILVAQSATFGDVAVELFTLGCVRRFALARRGASASILFKSI